MPHTLDSQALGRRLPALAILISVLLAGFASLGDVTGALAPPAHAQDEPQAAAAAAPLTQLSMSGEPGDFVAGTGSHLYREEDGAFGASASDRTGDGLVDYVSISFFNNDHFWFLDFGTNQLNQNLVPGLYANAQRAPFADPGHPGIDIGGDGRGCNQITGNFRVHEAEFDTTADPPVVVRFTASFEQHCEGGEPALLGTIYFKSTDNFPTNRISGRVARAGGAGSPGVQIVLSGSKTDSATTDANGNFSFPGLLRGGHYRLTPAESSNLIITPETTSVKNLLADRSVSFTSVPLHTLSGRVTKAGGTPITGVNVSLSGSETGEALTDAGGNYSFPGLRADGTYTVTPSRRFYGFTPPERTFDTLAGNTTANFTGALRSHTVSGRVSDQFGVGMGGVTVHLNGAQAATTQTDADGNYSFGGLTAGDTYAITPTARHFTFSPPAHDFFELDQDWANINFTAFRITHTLGGVVLDSNGDPMSNVIMILSGSQAGTTATDFNGNYSFTSVPAGGNYSVMPSKWDFVFSPSRRPANDLSADQSLSFVGRRDPTGFFVRQHYLDFLNREPDSGGLAFWSKGIADCGSDQRCIQVKRVDTSAAFFLSIEFQETGYLVYRMYKAAYGDATSPGVLGTVPVIRRAEFLPDTQSIGAGVIVGTDGWPEKLAANKRAFALEFVTRPRFLADYPASLPPAQFVGRLNVRAGRVLSAQGIARLIQELTDNNTPEGRAEVFMEVAEHDLLRRREFNRAFVLMQYYGYLQRDPDTGPDTNFGGWKFWLGKLDEHKGDFRRAEMVRAFIESIEYGKRFGN
jgi:hypothetical protein